MLILILAAPPCLAVTVPQRDRPASAHHTIYRLTTISGHCEAAAIIPRQDPLHPSRPRAGTARALLDGGHARVTSAAAPTLVSVGDDSWLPSLISPTRRASPRREQVSKSIPNNPSLKALAGPAGPGPSWWPGGESIQSLAPLLALSPSLHTHNPHNTPSHALHASSGPPPVH